MVIKPIFGEFVVSGDKSISHRALILASQALGKTVLKNISTGLDVLRTINALKQLGVPIKKKEKGVYEVFGVGVGGLSPSSNVLNMGNSGTSAQLFTGLMAAYPYRTIITGDDSLRKRPIKNTIAGLKNMCVDFIGESLPLIVIGSADTIPIEYQLTYPSAQLKSAILLAALNTRGTTTVVEKAPFSRDHTELMLKSLGAKITINVNSSDNSEERRISLEGQPELFALWEGEIPNDPSSAAFLVAIALMVPGSDIIIKNICINPTRIGFYRIIQKMGAKVAFINVKTTAFGESVADVKVQYSKLKGVNILPISAPSTIDEFPVLAIIASFAVGVTHMKGLARLRVKESDRINAMVSGLQLCGVNITSSGDNVIIEGVGAVRGGCKIKSCGDHRIAMSFYVCSLFSEEPIKVDSLSSIKTSFPEFIELVRSIISA